jgi:hypothetical protein
MMANVSHSMKPTKGRLYPSIFRILLDSKKKNKNDNRPEKERYILLTRVLPDSFLGFARHSSPQRVVFRLLKSTLRI